MTYIIEKELGKENVREDISEYESNNQESIKSKKGKKDLIDVRKCISIRKSLQREVDLRELLFSKMNDKERQLIIYRFDKNMSSMQIAERLYISESTYFRRFQKINNKLISYYDQFEEIFEQI